MQRSYHGRKRTDLALLFTLLALFMAIAIAVIALLDSHGAFHSWRYPPPPPLEVEAIVSDRAPVPRLPSGAALGQNGTLTIIRVPPTPVDLKPIIEGAPASLMTPVGRDLDPRVAGGVKAFFRTRPQPRNDRLILLEYRSTQLRLVLIDGCFRADGAEGPLVVFPTGARLFFDDGYLNVGVPGSPYAKARVGEELYWGADAAQISEPRSLNLIHSLCGLGAVLQVVPSSASVFAARQDVGAAMEFQRGSKAVSWPEAVRAVQECDRRMEAARRRDNPRSPEIFVENRCGDSRVNPPDPGNCLPGTRFERGNCLDGVGLVAPVAPPPRAAQAPSS